MNPQYKKFEKSTPNPQGFENKSRSEKFEPAADPPRFHPP